MMFDRMWDSVDKRIVEIFEEIFKENGREQRRDNGSRMEKLTGQRSPEKLENSDWWLTQKSNFDKKVAETNVALRSLEEDLAQQQTRTSTLDKRVSQINMALRLLQEDLQERLTKTSTLDNKVAEMNISLRSMQASLQDALNGRGSALR